MQWKGCFCKLLVTPSLHAQNPRPRHTRIRISTSFIIILSTQAKVPQVPVLRKPQAHWPSALVQGDVLKANSCKLRKGDPLVFKSLANFRRVSIVMLKSPKSIKSKKTWITTTHSSLQLTFWCYLWSFGKAALCPFPHDAPQWTLILPWLEYLMKIYR